jgi:hypothetical protein
MSGSLAERRVHADALVRPAVGMRAPSPPAGLDGNKFRGGDLAQRLW